MMVLNIFNILLSVYLFVQLCSPKDQDQKHLKLCSYEPVCPTPVKYS